MLTTIPSTGRLPETTLDWFKTNAIAEQALMLFTPSVQVSLRQHLRLGYWVTKCKPITPEAVKRTCKAISFADTPEGELPVSIAQEHINAVLCADQGFTQIVDSETGELMGWDIPELAGMLSHANDGYLLGAQGRADRAKRAAAARWAKSAAQPELTAETRAGLTGHVENTASDDF